MSDGGGRPGDVKPSNAIFDGAITHADALMLPQMLHPGLHDEAFDVAALCPWILVDDPVDGAVAAANRLEVADGLPECFGLRWIDSVFDLDPDGAIVGCGHDIEMRLGPVRRRGEIQRGHGP